MTTRSKTLGMVICATLAFLGADRLALAHGGGEAVAAVGGGGHMGGGGMHMGGGGMHMGGGGMHMGGMMGGGFRGGMPAGGFRGGIPGVSRGMVGGMRPNYAIGGAMRSPAMGMRSRMGIHRWGCRARSASPAWRAASAELKWDDPGLMALAWGWRATPLDSVLGLRSTPQAGSAECPAWAGRRYRAVTWQWVETPSDLELGRESIAPPVSADRRASAGSESVTGPA